MDGVTELHLVTHGQIKFPQTTHIDQFVIAEGKFPNFGNLHPGDGLNRTNTIVI